MLLLFYISGHGFGHASREVEIINALHIVRPDWRILIRSAVSPALLARSVNGPYQLIDGPCDTGIIQRSSVEHDDEATVRAALDFYATFDLRVEEESRTLRALGVTLIVADIPPVAFAVGARLGIPTVAIANFTWDWIYETHPGFLPVGQEILETIRTAYRSATLALELPFAGGFDLFAVVRPLPLVARRPTQGRTVTRRHFGLPETGRIALLSFGGYGLPELDLAAIDCRDHWTIATTDQTSPGASAMPHVRFISSAALASGAVRYEDLVAAVDVVITKPGYGIISECVAAGTPMVYTSRGHFREYDLLVDAMPSVLRCRYIERAELFAGRWREAIDGVLSQPDPPETMATDGAEVAAEILTEMNGSRPLRWTEPRASHKL